MEEGIQIIGVRTIKPIHEKECRATRYARENLKRRIGWSVRASLTADYDDAAIGQNACTRIPTSCLYDIHKN